MDNHRELIRLKGVEKWYGEQRVLKIAELTLCVGDRLILTGENGCGKSTLLKVLGGVVPIDRGKIWRCESLQAGRLGYVPQRGGLYNEMTVEGNLVLRRRLYGVDRQQEQTVGLGSLGLAPLRSKRFRELSGGYQRVAAFAAALSVDPSWLLLDEPFVGVDGIRREAMLEALRNLGDQLNLLVVTSPLPGDFPLRARSLRMENGEIQWVES